MSSPVVCVCGTTAEAHDVECSLCGRDLTHLRKVAEPGTWVPGRPAVSEPGPPVGWSPAAAEVSDPARRRSLALVVAAAVILLVAGVLGGIAFSGRSALSSGGAGAGGLATSPAPPSEAPADPQPSEPPPTPSEAVLSPTTGSEESPEPSSPEDPPARTGAPVEIVSFSDGEDCANTGERGAYGDYPTARCQFWKRSEGLLYGEAVEADKSVKTVVCQRDLERENPVFTPSQRNTWWVWAESDDGEWDWYPETALAQGASDQPVNGVALCR